MPNAQTPHSRKVRRDTANRCAQIMVDQGGRRLGVLLPPESASKLAAMQRETGKSARKLIIEMIAAFAALPPKK
jgi:hypothetical protein